MLILEKADGSHDTVSSGELSELLSLASGRLKLVTLSACFSILAMTVSFPWEAERRCPEQEPPDSCRHGKRSVRGNPAYNQ